MSTNKFPEYISDKTWDDGVDLLVKNKTTGIIEAIKSIKSFIYNKNEQTMELDQAYTTIYNNLVQNKEATKEFGEVFTSFEIINEMLDLLPKEVWSNPKLKWLDPCAGIGNFPIVIYDRLMIGLADIIDDEELRRQHILENMIHMVELQDKNVFVLLSALNPQNKYKLNLMNGSFLEKDFVIKAGTDWNIENFDIVVANPPYNPNNMWKEFVELSTKIVSDNGYVLMIHPATWRTSSKFKNQYTLITSGLHELHIKDFEAFKESQIAISIDLYLWKRTIKDTTIKYCNNEIDIVNIKDLDKILRFSINSVPYKIYKKLYSDNVKDNGINFINTGFASLAHEPTGTYKCCGGKGKGNGTSWTEGKFILRNSPTVHQFENKVVISATGKPRAHYFKGSEEIGVGLGNYWLTDNSALPILLNSKMFWKIICKIVDPDKGCYKPYGTILNIPSWILRTINIEKFRNISNENELYTLLGLTEDEINWIEN